VIQFYDGTQPTNRCSQPSSPQLIAVPAVVGKTQGRAEKTLQNYGYSVTVSTEPSAAAAPGTVLSQNPPGGALAYQATTVTITVATAPPPGPPPPVVVPNVIGMTQADAVLALAGAGFAVTVNTAWQCTPSNSCGAVPGTVWQESPPGGALDDAGTTVILWLNPTG